MITSQSPSARISFYRSGEILALVPLLGLLALVIWVTPDGVERVGWMMFFGQFHPLAVHLPIGLVLLVPVIEIAGRYPRLTYLQESAGFILGLALLSALVAPLLGWGLAWSGGYDGPLVYQHMWGGVALAVGCWMSLVAWKWHRAEKHRIFFHLYTFALLATVGLVAFTGYRGGQIAHGEDHLIRYLPDEGRRWLGLPPSGDGPGSAGVDSTTFYGARVHPILAARCTSCHGESKRKGNLRLDSYAALMKGGDSGAAVEPADLQGSELFRRISLPQEHEDFMPAEGKRPLTADEVKVIELWIMADASATLLVDAIADAPSGPAPTQVTEVVIEEFDPIEVDKSRAELAPIVARLKQKYPHVLEYESRGSADLYLNAYLLGSEFGDTELAEFAPLLHQIVLADLSNTSITDQSSASVAAMKRLRVLHVRQTQIGDPFIMSVEYLDDLQVLNTFDTGVTSEVLPTLRGLPNLKRAYVADTKISEMSSEAQALRDILIF